jgi:hypothetical protein
MPTDKPRRKISKETNPDHTSNLKTSEQWKNSYFLKLPTLWYFVLKTLVN